MRLTSMPRLFHVPQRLAAALARLTVGLCVVLLWAAAPAWAARHALVIGNDNYASVAKLRNARGDAEAMASALRGARYEVLLVTDRNLRQMQADVRSFRERLKPGDEVVVFYSGHGVQLGGMNFLLPVDVGSGSEEQVKDESIALGKLLQDLRTSRPALTLAIIDACRDNPFEGTGKNFGTRGLTGVAGASGQMVIYAAGEGQKALDRLSNSDPVRNGVFTRVFVREIAKPGVPIREVLYRVRDEVAALAEGVRHEQVPAVYDQVRGTFYFIAPGGVDRDSANMPVAGGDRPASIGADKPAGVDCSSAYYSVRPGDTIPRIALDHGVNWRDLARWNGLDNPNLIEVGQVLVVKAGCSLPASKVEQKGATFALGRANVKSRLGETLTIGIEIVGFTQREADTLSVRVGSAAAYKAAGLEYNNALSGAKVNLSRRPDGRFFATLRSEQPIQEPFLDIILEATWASGRLVREYSAVFDPPGR